MSASFYPGHDFHLGCRHTDALCMPHREAPYLEVFCKYRPDCFLLMFKVIRCKKLSVLFMLILYFPTGNPTRPVSNVLIAFQTKFEKKGSRILFLNTVSSINVNVG